MRKRSISDQCEKISGIKNCPGFLLDCNSGKKSVFLPYIGKVGYIANSPQTKAGGTESASRIYERVPKRFYVRVLFTTCTKIICRVEFGDMSDLNAELKSQTEDKWGDWDDEEDKIQF